MYSELKGHTVTCNDIIWTQSVNESALAVEAISCCCMRGKSLALLSSVSPCVHTVNISYIHTHIHIHIHIYTYTQHIYIYFLLLHAWQIAIAALKCESMCAHNEHYIYVAFCVCGVWFCAQSVKTLKSHRTQWIAKDWWQNAEQWYRLVE